MECAMAGFIVKNTLSDHGEVTRGVCLQEGNMLKEVHETSGIARRADGRVTGTFGGRTVEIDPDGLVSMNMWGFDRRFLGDLEAGFVPFLKEALAANPLKAEYLLPTAVDASLKAGRLTVEVLPTPDEWFGLTYHEDRDPVAARFAEMVEEGIYPSPLF